MKKEFYKPCDFCGGTIEKEFYEVFLNKYEEMGTLRREQCDVATKRYLICKKCYESRFSFI